jgi:hypothetical protein
MNIYQALIIYPEGYHPNALIHNLSVRDYPVVKITSENIAHMDELETKFRLFAMDASTFDEFLQKKTNIDSVTILVCLSDDVSNFVKNKIRNTTFNMSEKLYIFSCSNV